MPSSRLHTDIAFYQCIYTLCIIGICFNSGRRKIINGTFYSNLYMIAFVSLFSFYTPPIPSPPFLLLSLTPFLILPDCFLQKRRVKMEITEESVDISIDREHILIRVKTVCKSASKASRMSQRSLKRVGRVNRSLQAPPLPCES